MGHQPSAQPLSILIVGAGLGGLGAAISLSLSNPKHHITVLESARSLQEVGAGLQITPNASRLLQSWSLPPSLWSNAAEPTQLTVHRYDGKVLSHSPAFSKEIRGRYNDAPFIDLHRVDLQQALYTRAKELGVESMLGSRVKSADTTSLTPSITLESGDSLTADLIVAADGLWSACRTSFTGLSSPPVPTGDLAYRVVLSADDHLSDDPELYDWVTKPQVHFWIGPGAHAVGYSLRGGKMYNIVLLVPDDLPEGVSRTEGNVEGMKKLFVGWDPILTRFLDKVKGVDKWKLMHRESNIRD
jgi:salicylate hydroxylase